MKLERLQAMVDNMDRLEKTIAALEDQLDALNAEMDGIKEQIKADDDPEPLVTCQVCLGHGTLRCEWQGTPVANVTCDACHGIGKIAKTKFDADHDANGIPESTLSEVVDTMRKEGL